jgi:hypothetical protein
VFTDLENVTVLLGRCNYRAARHGGVQDAKRLEMLDLPNLSGIVDIWKG